MNNFDFGALGGLMSGLQQRVEEMKRRAAQTEVTGSASGGLVTVTVTGDFKVKAVTIQEDAMGDRELLEDLVRAATDEALRLAREETQKSVSALTGGLPLPPGLF